MPWNTSTNTAQADDLIQIVGLRHKHFIFTLVQDGELHTHKGIVKHNDLIGATWGSQIFSHTGSPFFLLQPMLGDILTNLKRNTQILYPKDIGFLLVNMGIGPGKRVLEAGTGSGSMTIALSYTVGNEGKVYSYERRPEFQQLARKNITRLGLENRVDFKLGDIEVGFEEREIDAVFLDVANPYDYIEQVRECLLPGGFFGSLVPTMNQAARLIKSLQRNQFAFIEMTEILMRYFKPEPSRIRPTDRMVAHTGYLVFGRKINVADEKGSMELLKEIGMISKLDADDRESPEEAASNEEGE